MNTLSSTSNIVENITYFKTPTSFFANFPMAFDLTRSQILKIETRQSYIENENKSYQEMRKGSFERSLELLEASRKDDKDIYDSLKSRGIDFIRCRPIKYPLSDYIKWELHVYDYNSIYGERIFCCNYEVVKEILKNNILHDFMVFDSRLALIHNYDSDGEIRGGWITYNIDHIIELQKMFIFFKSLCNPYTLYK